MSSADGNFVPDLSGLAGQDSSRATEIAAHYQRVFGELKLTSTWSEGDLKRLIDARKRAAERVSSDYGFLALEK